MTDLQRIEGGGVDGTEGKERVASENESVRPEFCAGIPLPAEIFTIIGQFLIGEFKFGSLASLNITSSLIRDATNAVLWTTLLLDGKTPSWSPLLRKLVFYKHKTEALIASLRDPDGEWERHKQAIGEIPSNMNYVKYVLLARDCDIERVWFTTLFPNLRLLIETHDNQAVDDAGKLLNEPNVITIWVYLPVSCTLLFWHVLRTPMRQSIDSQAFLETPASVRTINLCRDSGYVYGHPPLDAHTDTGLQKPVLLAPRIIKLTEMLTSHSPKHSDPLALEITNLTLTQRLMMALFGVLEVAGHSKKVLEERSEMTTSDQARTFPDSPCLFLQLHPEELDYLVAKFPKRVRKFPDILWNRLSIKPTIFDIPQEITLEYLRERIDILLECYIKHPHMFPASETVDWAINIQTSTWMNSSNDYRTNSPRARISGIYSDDGDVLGVVADIKEGARVRSNVWYTRTHMFPRSP